MQPAMNLTGVKGTFGIFKKGKGSAPMFFKAETDGSLVQWVTAIKVRALFTPFARTLLPARSKWCGVSYRIVAYRVASRRVVCAPLGLVLLFSFQGVRVCVFVIDREVAMHTERVETRTHTHTHLCLYLRYLGAFWT